MFLNVYKHLVVLDRLHWMTAVDLLTQVPGL